MACFYSLGKTSMVLILSMVWGWIMTVKDKRKVELMHWRKYQTVIHKKSIWVIFLQFNSCILLFFWNRCLFQNLMWTIGQDSVFSMTVAWTWTKSQLRAKRTDGDCDKCRHLMWSNWALLQYSSGFHRGRFKSF